jgi:CarD family transcriptional regulator
MTAETLFDVGDWIVHNAYGVGQIRKIEKRPIHGEKVKTFRVRTKDSVYWLPLENSDNPRVRSVVNKRELRKVFRILKSRPKAMAKNYKTRNARIREDFEDGSLKRLAKLMRDLIHLGKQKKYNMTEQGAIDKIEKRFTREYAACHEILIEEARSKIAKEIAVARKE